MDNPKALIGIVRFESHNIIVSVKPYIKPDDYWHPTFEALERINKGFNDAGIEMTHSEGVKLGEIGD